MIGTRSIARLGGALLALWCAAAAPMPDTGVPDTGARGVVVLVLQHAVPQGTLLSADDFAMERRDAIQARSALSLKGIAGREATRNLAAGLPLRVGDVASPRLVRRGEPVTIIVREGALLISANGRALGSGGEGDLVRVFSLATNKTLDAIVDGPGRVRLGAMRPSS